MADELRKDAGNNVQVMDGARGEFTVLVNGQEVARKKGEHEMPDVQEVVSAVRNAGTTKAGAGR